MYLGRTEFYSTRWRKLWSLALFLGATLVTVYYSRAFEFSWLSVFFIGFAILCFFGFLESVTSYIILDENKIRFRKSFLITGIDREKIEKVTWEKGSGVAVLLKSGEWNRIPDMGHNSQGLANSLRSWIRNDKPSPTNDE